MLKIAVVDDIKAVRKTVVNKINLSADMKVVSEFTTGREVLHAMRQGLEVDVIVMDIEMPEMSGIEATEKILSEFPKSRILMCTVFDDEHNLFRAICAGAKGYLLKDEKPEKLHRAIFETMEGGSAMSPAMAMKALDLVRNGPPQSKKEINENSPLTSRELEMLELIAKGKSYEQVADIAGISYGTVRKHLENVYKKLNVHSKIEAVNKAQREGLL